MSVDAAAGLGCEHAPVPLPMGALDIGEGPGAPAGGANRRGSISIEMFILFYF